MDDETEIFEHAGCVCTLTRNVSEVSGAIAWSGCTYLPNGEKYVTGWKYERHMVIDLVQKNAEAAGKYLEMRAAINAAIEKRKEKQWINP